MFVVFAVVAAGCSPSIDLTAALRLDAVTTGWLDAGGVNGMTKLVPAVSLTVKNVSTQPLRTVQINAVFRRAGDPSEWGSGYLAAAREGGLPPGAATSPLLLQSEAGYTGTEPREVMLRNSQFVDARVDVYAKTGAQQWTRIGEYDVNRALIEAR